MKTATDALGLTLSYEYNTLDKVTRVSYPDGTSEETDYVCCGLAGMTKDRAGRKTYYDYDALKRLTRVQDAAGQSVEMNYDAAGNRTRLIDAKGNETRWSYDSLDRLVGKSFADGSSQSYSYDSVDNLTATRDAKGQVTNYAYDANDNLTGIDYPNMADVTFSYDALDRVTQVVDGIGAHSFGYDNSGRLNALDGPFAEDAQSFGFDAQERLQSHSIGRGASGGTFSQSYAYDALERVQSLTSSGPGGAGLFTYNYKGNTDVLSRLDLPNGTKVEQNYDALQRLSEVKNLSNAGANLASYAYAYAYDTRDVRTGVQSQFAGEPLKQVAYSYDTVDQLTGEVATGGAANAAYSNAFQYDSMGNRTQGSFSHNGTSTLTTGTSNRLNQLSALSRSSNGLTSTTALLHDSAGNLTQQTASDGSKTLYAYDDADRLWRIEWRNAANAPLRKSEFTYDYASRKAVSAEFLWQAGAWALQSETRRVFDGLDVVQERNAANEVTAQLTRDGNIGGILARSTASGVSYFGYDGGGNVTLLTDEAGAEVGRYSYDAFGNTLEAAGVRAGENPYRFSTKEYHAASGLYDYGFRFYSASTGRWINRDPIQEAGGGNFYTMVGNNPVNAVDAYGLQPSLQESWNDFVKPATDFYNSAARVYRKAKLGVGHVVEGGVNAFKGVSVVDGGLAASVAQRQATNPALALPGQADGPQDALRHCLWQCHMTRAKGALQAEKMGNTHEWRGNASGNAQWQNKGAEAMDQHNNREGRKSGVACAGKSGDACLTSCYDKLYSGNLKWITEHKLPPKVNLRR